MRRRTLIPRAPLTLKSLTFREWFSFVRGWEPPPSFEARGTRWRTWREFLEDYGQVRDEFLEQRAQHRRGTLSFAECVWEAPRTSRGREVAIDRYQAARDAERGDTTDDEGNDHA
jgi:hypothetical protein